MTVGDLVAKTEYPSGCPFAFVEYGADVLVEFHVIRHMDAQVLYQLEMVNRFLLVVGIVGVTKYFGKTDCLELFGVEFHIVLVCP